MTVLRSGAVILLVACAAIVGGAATRPESNEPFASFRAVDKQLSLLDKCSATLKTEVPSPERNRCVHQMRLAIQRIRQRSSRLARLYRTRGETFGVKMFTELDRKALVLAKALDAVQREKIQPRRDRALDLFSKATLGVVLQFQAVSANYGANHCLPRQWACCEPKRDPETNRESVAECKWVCVEKSRACAGFLGPRTVGK